MRHGIRDSVYQSSGAGQNGGHNNNFKPRMETPVFRLGLVGFDEREEQLLRAGVAPYRKVQWRCGRAEGADAWLINGPRVGRMHDTLVRVVASAEAGGGKTLLLDVGSRPTAVATPAPHLLQQLTGLSFDLRQPASLSTCLAAFDARLGQLRRLYSIAAHLVRCNEVVGKAVYELRAGTQLLAVADMKGMVLVHPGATDAQLEKAVWKHRARKMLEVPQDFEQHALAEVLWTYTTRTRLDLLPQRYLECPVYLRRPPRVRAELLGDVHLRIIRELAVSPARLVDLVDRTGADARTLGRGLAALYYVGSVTSNPDRAWAASQQAGPWSTRASLIDDGAQGFRLPLDAQPSTTPLM